jgi:GT2 family glycosyltransferase
MSMPGVDIIVPVWNRPVETRECLVNLVRFSPGARLILLNNGCDRETESLLEEFAEALDERALLISTGLNLGFVRAVNRGLARAEAEFAAVVRSSSLVTERWLEPLLHVGVTREEAGIIVPRLVNEPGDRRAHGASPDSVASERSRGDFAAMLIRRSLYERIGGFDEEMDGGTWCLKDFSRRALTSGLLTYAVSDATVRYVDEPPLGSLSRREEVLARSIAAYNERWGEERSFCIHFPKDADSALVRRKLDVMLAGARQGHYFTVMVSPGTFAKLARAGCASLHGNMALKKYPRIFPDRWARKETATLRGATPGLMVVVGLEGRVFPGDDDPIPFAQLERLISADGATRYGEAGKPAE